MSDDRGVGVAAGGSDRMNDAPSPMIDVTVFVLVDDLGQCTAGQDSDEDLWRCHEGRGGYTALQLYELKLTLPRPRGVIELAATLPALPEQEDGPITISISRKAPEAA